MIVPCQPIQLDRSVSGPLAFELGNYTTTALLGSPDEWQTFAALGLVGRTDRALPGLSRFDHLEEARFYRGVAAWIGGDDAAALQDLLPLVEHAHAQRLAQLIQKPQIHVLTQWPSKYALASFTLAAIDADPHFRLSNLGFNEGDLQNRPGIDLHQLYRPDDVPDFYACVMLEWHYLPQNLHSAPFPTLAHTADFDLHIQIIQPWLAMFDELIVNDGTEYQHLRGLSHLPISTMPLTFCIRNNLPPLHGVERPIDVYLSGTNVHPYHPDKLYLLENVLAERSLKLHLQNGFTPAEEYYQHLNRAKANYCYIRHTGCMPSRAVEGLAMGNAMVVDRASVFRLYFTEEDGCFPYDLGDQSLPQQLLHIVQHWDQIGEAAQRGARRVRKELHMQRVVSQYLRFLTFLAARPRPRRRPYRLQPPLQKRAVLWKGWTPSRISAWQEYSDANLQALEQRLQRNVSANTCNELLREVVLAYYSYDLGLPVSKKNERLLHQTLDFCSRVVDAFPENLVLRFNMIRASLYFAEPKAVTRALHLLDQVLTTPPELWQLQGTEDVMPWDFAYNLFNYRRYLDLMTLLLSGERSATVEAVQVMRASLYYHLSKYTGRLEHLRQAYQLDPEYSTFALGYARALVEQQQLSPEQDQEALQLLEPLARHSAAFSEAVELLMRLQQEGRIHCPELPELERRKLLLEKNVRDLETIPMILFKPAYFDARA